MSLLICDKAISRALIVERQSQGLDRYDEVWNGVYVMAPMANDEHQQLVSRFNSIMEDVIGWPGLGEVRPGVNISDQEDDWRQNYRIPDVAVFLRGCTAVNRDTHWFGGPDWLTEIISADEQFEEKMEFHAKLGVREVLLVFRDPWAVELYRLQQKKLVLVGRSDLKQPDKLQSNVLPLSFQMVAGIVRPLIMVRHTDGTRQWHV